MNNFNQLLSWYHESEMEKTNLLHHIIHKGAERADMKVVRLQEIALYQSRLLHCLLLMCQQLSIQMQYIREMQDYLD